MHEEEVGRRQINYKSTIVKSTVIYIIIMIIARVLLLVLHRYATPISNIASRKS